VVVASGRRPALAAGDVLLAGSGAVGRALRAVPVGARVAVAFAVVTDAGVRLREAVGSGSVMLRGGRDLATCDGSGDVSRPRTLLAWDAARSRIWLLTVDGRGWEAPVSRYGLTYRQMTEAARALGASEAVMVDGGGSTTMALRGADGVVRRVDAPANAPQREVPDGLVLVPR
jgi:exopolysaccharide biosynthesis protein